MDPLVQRLRATISREDLIPARSRILVAVSGGVDSMVLLHALCVLADESRWKLEVAHFNHQLRGAASRSDERLVRSTCVRLSLPCHVGQGDVRRLAGEKGVSIEMAARELRHQFLARTARRRRIKMVALAHHANDQVETLFLKLLRGAGGAGLGGMSVKSPSPFSVQIHIIRPLLGERKQDLLEYARVHGVRFREDATNTDLAMRRNRVRGRLMPMIENEFGPAALGPLFQSMEIIRAEADLAETQAREWLRKHPKQGFKALHPAVQRHCIRLELLRLKIEAGFRLIEQLRRSPGVTISAQGDLITRAAGSGLVSRVSAGKTRYCAVELEIDLRKQSQIEFEGVNLSWWQEPAPKRFRKPNPQRGMEVFDADQVGTGIVLRHWRPGDRFQPIGMPGAVKLQDLFVNARIPVSERHELVMSVTLAGQIVWVEGLRISEPFKVTAATRSWLCWCWQKTGLPA